MRHQRSSEFAADLRAALIGRTRPLLLASMSPSEMTAQDLAEATRTATAEGAAERKLLIEAGLRDANYIRRRAKKDGQTLIQEAEREAANIITEATGTATSIRTEAVARAELIVANARRLADEFAEKARPKSGPTQAERHERPHGRKPSLEVAQTLPPNRPVNVIQPPTTTDPEKLAARIDRLSVREAAAELRRLDQELADRVLDLLGTVKENAIRSHWAP